MRPSPSPPVIVYTDASCEPGPTGVVVNLCYIDGQYRSGGVASFSDSLFASFESKSTFISHGEAFAPLLCLYHEWRHLTSRSVIWFIDNLGVLCCYCKGSSSSADVGCIVHASLLMQAKHRVCSWYEHVDSKANCSDGGTRNSTVVADKLQVTLKPRALPPWPSNTIKAPATVWLEWLCGRCEFNG